MISNINLNRLRNGEFIQFHKQVLAFILSANPDALNVSGQYEKLKQEWQSLKQLFNKQNGSELTKELEQVDLQRDKLIVGLRMYFESFTYHFDDRKSEAGNLLLNSIDRYGKSISRKNYQEESAILSSILGEWESNENYTQGIKLLKAQDWQVELRNLSQQFEATYRERTEDLTSIPDETVSTLKAPVIEAYSTLAKHLSAHATLTDDKAPYDHLVQVLNQHVDQYNRLIKLRSNNSVETIDLELVSVN